jgi:hypothetical protein
VFDFDYLWEVYTPEHKRRWGYYVLPILFGDRFVGRFEPRFDRVTGTLRILGLWWEDGFDPRTAEGFEPAMRRALAAYMRFGGVRSVDWAPHLGGAKRLIGVKPARVVRRHVADQRATDPLDRLAVLGAPTADIAQMLEEVDAGPRDRD